MDIEPSQDGMSELLAALDDAPKLETQEAAPAEPEEQAVEQTQEQPQEEPAPELVDLDGKKLEIPNGTPPELVKTIQSMARDLKADHTRKTQTAADEMRRAQAFAQEMQQREQVMAATADKWAEARAAQQTVEQFKQIDWSALADQDPQQATKLMARFQQAQSDFQSKTQEWQRAAHEMSQRQTEQQATALAQNWEKATELARKSLGEVSEQTNVAAQKWLMKKAGTEDMRQIVQRFGDPVVLEAIVKAAQWDAAQGKPMQKVAQAPKAIKPSAPQPQRENQSALDRLKKTGRASELINFL